MSFLLPWDLTTDRSPVAERVAGDLARRIATGEIPPGALLTEVETAAAYGASRTPMREAMLRLERWGLVRLVPKKGSVVTSPLARERHELLGVRAMFERDALAAIAPSESLRAAAAADMRDALAGQEAALGDATAFAASDYAGHMSLIRAAGNGVVEEILTTLAPRLYRLTHLAVTTSPTGTDGLLDGHRALADAVAAGDEAAFGAALDAHLSAGHPGYLA
ncbi:GntR family transcriptional regulator [Microbacterium indicum]|uniref:GntR family transcriptional regulator n=1 Tax=Microbacterium indicum TaxID=358100 RepID=UPI00041BF1FB|nr:GntR family transcriptional regulator [Microbacterium indicum]